jgi:hypothetical protein
MRRIGPKSVTDAASTAIATEPDLVCRLALTAFGVKMKFPAYSLENPLPMRQLAESPMANQPEGDAKCCGDKREIFWDRVLLLY